MSDLEQIKADILETKADLAAAKEQGNNERRDRMENLLLERQRTLNFFLERERAGKFLISTFATILYKRKEKAKKLMSLLTY
jgi:hypothetical protein